MSVGMRGIERSAFWLLFGQAARLGLQGAAFVLVARALGPSSFGEFTAALALASLFAPFVEVGSYSLAVRDYVRGQNPSVVVGNSLLAGIVVTPIAFVALMCAGRVVVPAVSLWLIAGVGFASFLGIRPVSTFRGIALASGHPWRIALLDIIGSAAQLAMAVALLLLQGTVHVWAWLFFLYSAIYGGVALLWLTKLYGRPPMSWAATSKRLIDGIHFAIAAAAFNAHGDVDRTLLARMTTLQDTGVYGFAQRLVNMLLLPLLALLGAVYPRFFRLDASSVDHHARLAGRVAVITVPYGALAAVAAMVVAPVIPRLLGAGYDDTSLAIRLLAPTLIIQAATYPFADALSGSGLQSVRSILQVTALVVNITLNILFIPSLGWRGAAYASIASHSVFLALLVIAAKVRGSRQRARRVA